MGAKKKTEKNQSADYENKQNDNNTEEIRSVEEIQEETNLLEQAREKNENQYIVFQLDDQEYAIDIKQVHEINRLKEIVISPVPKTPDFVEGIINLRGEVVPVIDLRRKFELEKREIAKGTRILIVKIGNKMIGLLVDGVSEVVDIAEARISEPPEEICDINTKYINGVARLEKRLILLLDINEIMVSEESVSAEKSIKE